jgi:ABC-2 type transport system permease protein
MSKILTSIVRKEFMHIWRDPQTLMIILVWPVIMLLLFSYAITLEMRGIPTAVVDKSDTPASRHLIECITSSGFFSLVARDMPPADYEELFQRQTASCLIVIPADYAETIIEDQFTDVQVLIDATDPNAANFIHNYLGSVLMQVSEEQSDELLLPFTLAPRFLYNPNLESTYFFVPGLIAIILLLISALLTSIAIVREKEKGTLEQILVSPARASQIIIGKVIPYVILGFIDGILVLALGVVWFNVPMRGELWQILLSMLLYISTGLSFGLLISTVARSQQTAMMLALMATILPTIMLSGFIFPVDSMPLFFQYLSKIVPATHFLEIIRGIMLKGIGLSLLWKQVLYLLILTLFLVVVSVRKFKTVME